MVTECIRPLATDTPSTLLTVCPPTPWHVNLSLIIFSAQFYPAFGPPPGPPMPVPFVPPPPAVRPPTDPAPPLFMPTAQQHHNHSSVQSPPVIPASTTRRRSATPYPSAFPDPEPESTPPSRSKTRTSRPPPATDDMNGVQEPLGSSSAAAFGLPPARRPSQSRTSNPLPPPPKDVYDMTPYRGLLNLPQTTALLTSTYGSVNRPPPRDHAEVDRKKSLKGLFRSRSGNKKRREENPIPFVPVTITQPQSSTSPPASMRATGSSSLSPSATQIRFDHSTYPGFMNHSPHRIIHQNKTYPTALHLHEAMKFIDHRPDLSEQIRSFARVQEVYPFAASQQEFVRPDWGQIFLKTVGCCDRFLAYR